MKIEFFMKQELVASRTNLTGIALAMVTNKENYFVNLTFHRNRDGTGFFPLNFDVLAELAVKRAQDEFGIRDIETVKFA